MLIAQSRLSLSSSYLRTETTATTERLRAWVDTPQRQRNAPTNVPRETSTAAGQDEVRGSLAVDIERLQLAAEALRIDIDKEIESAAKPGKRLGHEKKDDETSRIGESGDIRMEVMRLIIEQISGRKVLVATDELPDEEDAAQAAENSAAIAEQRAPSEAPEAPQAQGWGLEYERTEIHVETEASSFSSSGVIRTVDGQEIAFDVSLQMSREKIEVSHLSVRAGDALRPVDPLVINFGGNAAALTSETMDFDLDANGADERISFLASGSGFLVLDRNANGAVDSGAELFGPTSGDGFAELAQHDDDGNGWIDEADGVYSQLGVWTGRQETGDTLLTLQEANVGAIHLGSVTTPYTLETSTGQAAGLVRSTGVYVKEDGGVGTVQQIDLLT